METLKNKLEQLDLEQTKHELFLSKEDFNQCKKELEDMRVAGYLGLLGLPGLKTRSIYFTIKEQDIRFMYKDVLVILAEDKKEDLQKKNIVYYEINNDKETNIID